MHCPCCAGPGVGDQKRLEPLCLVTFMAKGFVLSADLLPRLSTQCSGVAGSTVGRVCWWQSVPSRRFPIVDTALCAGLLSHLTTASMQSTSILTSSHLPASSSPICSCHATADRAAGSEERKGCKSLVLSVFKCPFVNILGSWEAVRCLIWNVLCYPSF